MSFSFSVSNILIHPDTVFPLEIVGKFTCVKALKIMWGFILSLNYTTKNIYMLSLNYEIMIYLP